MSSSSLSGKLSSLIQALRTSLAPLTPYSYTPGNDDVTPKTEFLKDIQNLGFKDYETLLTFLNASITGVNNDDKLLLERLVQILAKLPLDSKELKQLSDGFISQLWNTLDHPPAESLGNQYKYRKADGSYNSISNPQLGASNTPYARSVTPAVFQTPDLPEPGLIFDSLMARGEAFEPHPQGISSMLFYLATVIIHDIFQTSSKDYNVNLTSSYLDLSPLYGRNDDEVKLMRTFNNGLLKPDCFSSQRILGFPPGCSVFLIMFNRFHNYVVTQLAIINESGRFTKPTGDDASAWSQYDEDLFQTGRLITCGLYVNIVLKDYVRTILALNRTNSNWSLDPRTKEGKNIFSNGSPEGVGNQVSVEFNVIYRWHSVISLKDEQWTIAEMKRLLHGQDPTTASTKDVLGALRSWLESVPAEPEQRTFEDLQRLPDGTFKDEDLVKILTESIEDTAGSYGANKVPQCLRAVEVLGIMQSRYWNLGTLNEFRSFVGLTKHTTFEDINPDPVVAAKLRQLYDSPDSVEMYPGLVAEKPKPPMTPGSGLCGNYSMTQAILSDAVTLVRGDRYYTVDYTPGRLTNWGFNEVDYDANVDGGQVMSKLIFRAFPNHFVNNSIYAHFPFVTPKENLAIHENLGTSNQYSWEKPKERPSLVVIKSYKAVTQILNNQQDFKVTWGEAMNFLTESSSGKEWSKDYCLAGDGKANLENRQYIIKCLYPAQTPWREETEEFFRITTARLLKKHGYPLPQTQTSSRIRTYEVDLVRDVIALATANFGAALWSLPIKTEHTPRGIYSEEELSLVLFAAFAAIFFDADIANSFKLRSQAREVAQQLGSLVELNAKVVKSGNGLVESLVNTLSSFIYPPSPEWPTLKSYGDSMVQRLLKQKGYPLDKAVWGSILLTSAAGGANQTQVLSQAVDYYLGEGSQYLPEMYTLAHSGRQEDDERLMRYMLEGSRLRGTVAAYRDLATDQSVSDYSPSVASPDDPSSLDPQPNQDPKSTSYKLKAGSRILVDLVTANHDPAGFEEPETIRLDRDLDSYLQFGWGPHLCLGRDMSRVGLGAAFKAIVGLRNLRRTPGPRGQIKSFPATTWNGQVGSERNPDAGWTGLRMYMTADQSSYWPIPTTMRVQWDE